MSLGSLSPEAHQTITAGMNMLGGRSNTGEGGEDREVYRVRPALVPVGPSGGSGGSDSTRAAMQNGGGVAVAEHPEAPGCPCVVEQQDQAGGFGSVRRHGGVPGACRGD